MNATAHWSALAERKAAFAQAIAPLDPSAARQAIAESLQAGRTAEALRLEDETGIPHCGCTNPPHPVNR